MPKDGLPFQEEREAETLHFRRPRSNDGAAVNDLVSRCRPLDENSLYCNLVQCTHFAGTSVTAERNGELLGFVSGHLLPDHPDALFIWQVAVDETARGQGLAKRMLGHILSRPALRNVRELHTTITQHNMASQRLFRSLAKDLGSEFVVSEYFKEEDHFDGCHESEFLWRVGPFRWADVNNLEIGRPAA